jgi:glycerol-3-phosphate acyltransferase PlsY
LGSIAAGLSFVIASCIFYPYPVDMIIIVICGGLLIWGHRGNIVRLLHGNERKFSFHKKGDHQS